MSSQTTDIKCKVCGGVLSKRTSLGYVCDFCGCAENVSSASYTTVPFNLSAHTMLVIGDNETLLELLQKDHKDLQDAYNRKVEECYLAYDTISVYADRNRELKTMLSVFIGLTFLFGGLSFVLLYMYVQ